MDAALQRYLEQIEHHPLTSFKGVGFRMHNPIWAWSPLSTDGARITGGRFNPKGASAFYLSQSVAGCHAEVSSGSTSALLSPQVLCSYEVNVDSLLDLTAVSELFEPAWRLAILQKSRPVGWQLYDAIQRHSHINGLLVPSYVAPHETNIVLYSWPENAITLHDPEQRLKAAYQLNLKD